MNIRIGFGVDVHQLIAGRPLFIGGVHLPAEKGALGHSDADVLLHAICDALLGAANLRDIGFHFSDQDPAYKGIDSKILLRKCYELIQQEGYHLVNIDATVILEQPKVNPHIDHMKTVISEQLDSTEDKISIKATTHEKVDSFGAGEAIKAYAVCLINK